MSNPLTTKTHEALWDERLDLDPAMAILYEINVQHEINRICSVKTDPDMPRLAAMHVLKARYRAMVMVAGETMSTPAVNVVRYYESMGSEMLVSGGSMPSPESAARNVSLKNEQADDSEKSPVFEDSNEWPNTRDGVPRCFHHPNRPWAIYHPASACRELKEQQKLYGNSERRVQKQATRRAPSLWSSYNDNNTNNRFGYRNYPNTARDNYLRSDHRRPKYRDLGGGPGQDRRRQSRSLSPRSRRRYRFRLDHEEALNTLRQERKTMKREAEALETSREPSIEPEDLDAKYQAAGKKYLETKKRLDLATKNNPGMVEEHKVELTRARWPGDVPFARSEERKIECEAWEAQATRDEEAIYWRTLTLAAYCFLEGMLWAGAIV
ncbi:hypothetical protein KCU92_g2846, partial [Aureobasidium melanogenum]